MDTKIIFRCNKTNSLYRRRSKTNTFISNIWYFQGDKGDMGATGAKGMKGHTGHKGDQVDKCHSIVSTTHLSVMRLCMD